MPLPRPSMRRARRLAVLAAATAIGGFLACSGTTAPPAAVTLPGTPSITIVSPAPGACVAVPPGQTMPVVPIQITIGVAPLASAAVDAATTVLLDTVLLRPPGQCFGVAQCGHLELRVRTVLPGGTATGQGELNDESAATVIDFDLSRLGNRYGTYDLEVAVYGDPTVPDASTDVVVADGQANVGSPPAVELPLLDPQGLPVADHVRITVAPSCGPVDGGAGGAGPDAGTGGGGAGGKGGAGGANAGGGGAGGSGGHAGGAGGHAGGAGGHAGGAGGHAGGAGGAADLDAGDGG